MEAESAPTNDGGGGGEHPAAILTPLTSSARVSKKAAFLFFSRASTVHRAAVMELAPAVVLESPLSLVSWKVPREFQGGTRKAK